MKMLKMTALASVAALTWQAHAADVKGTITDNQGKPVQGAVVKVKGSTFEATTDENGRYSLANLADGHVHLHVYSTDHIHGTREFDNASGMLTADFVLETSTIENIVVRAHAMETSVIESVTPVTVLTGDELRDRQAPTIGETLKATPGIHSSYYGPVAANPIIRGNDGPRVKITQNSLDVSDASRVGADHNVGTDAAGATQIEVMRGPATLQYGSGAIGGVVNVVDNRIPTDLVEGLDGEVEARYETALNERFGRVDLNTSAGNFAFHLDAFDRQTDDAEIPGFAERDPEEDAQSGVLENSEIDTQNIAFGLSYVGEKGFLGFSVQQLDNEYGIPGGHGHHGHDDGHDDEHEEEGHEEEGHDEEEEENVFLDVDNRRYQLAGELLSPFEGINNIKLNAGYTDYEHVEQEGGEPGTRFANETTELRLSMEHESIAGWHGVLGLHVANTEFEAIGEEAFTPPNETDMFALYLIEEKQFGNVTVQLGGRIERNELSADSFGVPLHNEEEHHDEEDEEHHDEEGEEHHDEDEHHEDELTLVEFPDADFTSVSLSAGANWEYTPGYSVAVNLSRSERAPAQQELFSAGRHLATRTFDLGAFFTTNDEGEIELSGNAIEEEVSTNIDLTWRKFSGDWGFTFTAFYNQVDDYLYQADTGFFFEEGHEEEHSHDEDEHGDEHEGEEHEGEEHHDDEEEGTPILNFRQEDADLYGFEAEVHYQINDIWHLQVFGDYVRADVDSGDLPRIPPLRIGAQLEFDYRGWQGDIGATWYDDQTNVADFENETNGYTLLELGVDYAWSTQNVDWIFFARGTNLTDREARVHTSFLVDQATLPGRGFTMGVRAQF